MRQISQIGMDKLLHGCYKQAIVLTVGLLLGACTTTPAPLAKNQSMQHQRSQHQIKSHDTHGSQATHHEHTQWSVGSASDFEFWLQAHPEQTAMVAQYHAYLVAQLGNPNAVPPMHELLTTARSWQACGFEPYQVPPNTLWTHIIPTIRLYNELKTRGILPSNTQIRSVYRNPELNVCAGGAAASRHLTNAAIDIWVPNYDESSAQMAQLQDALCQFWLDNGKIHEFGLGIYATGAIHLDTQGYRKWGAQFSQEQSVCRNNPISP